MNHGSLSAGSGSTAGRALGPGDPQEGFQVLPVADEQVLGAGKQAVKDHHFLLDQVVQDRIQAFAAHAENQGNP